MINAPQPLVAAHQARNFDCGEPALDDWLKRRALHNQLSGASRTFVVVDAQLTVLGYYALAAGAVTHSAATGAIRRNMPDPIPVLVLGRLAIDRSAQGAGLGSALLKDAVLRAIQVSQNTGVRALLVHAIHEEAGQFYRHYGFVASPHNPLTLMLALKSLKI
jgi:GNAT superfamily N-acetyltransferase